MSVELGPSNSGSNVRRSATGLGAEEVTANWRVLRNEDVGEPYCSLSANITFIWVIRSRNEVG